MPGERRKKSSEQGSKAPSKLSLFPLDFETALSAALKTGKPSDSKRKKSGKKTAKRGTKT